MPKILCVCGARPNFMKIAPIMDALAATRADAEVLLVYTGQHYDDCMSRLFFDDLGIPKPDLNLDVGSGSHAAQTAAVMSRFEPVCLEHKPDWVVVVGDVNSTPACALVSVKLGIGTAHVEAGLRSFDRSMPEEINRIVTDAISDLLFVSEPSGVGNLVREGIPEEKIHFVGNVMIDSLMRTRALADKSAVLRKLGLRRGQYALITLHRPSNVDDPRALRGIIEALSQIAGRMPVVYPVHPRTQERLVKMGLSSRIEAIAGLRLTDPLGYLDFTRLLSDAAVVLTDSGGIQEETTALNVPCLTLRDNTERPVTIEQGTNRLTGTDPGAILAAFEEVGAVPPRRKSMPALWDGRAAERIAERLLCSSLTRSSVAATAKAGAQGVCL